MPEAPYIAPVTLPDGRRWPDDFPPTDEAGPDGRTWWERARAQDALAEVRRRALRHARMAALPRGERRRIYRAEFLRCKGRNEFDVAAFLYWCGNYGWVRAEKESSTGSPLNDGYPPLIRDMPFMLWESQREAAAWFFERLRRKEDALVPKSREVGITWLVLHIILWIWTFHGGAFLLGSRKDELVDKSGDMRSLFERLRYILDRQPPHLRPRYREKNKNLRRLDDPSAQINGESTNGDFARSGRYRLVLVDEYGAIDAPKARAILRSIASTGPCWFVYNPAGERHPSYTLYTSFPAERKLVLSWRADPYRPSDFFEMQILPHGKLNRAEAEREWNCSHREIAEGLIFEWNPDAEYDDDSPEWVEALALGARERWVQLGGWDFGSGTSLTVNTVCLIQVHPDNSVTVWFDDCRFWSQQAYTVIAEEARQMIVRTSTGLYKHYGDPAGRQRDANQGNWEGYLRESGINLECLEHAFNTFEVQEWAIRCAAHMMANLRIRFHRTRCAPLIASLKAWRRRVPEGVPLEEVNGRVAPMKDWPSHGSQSFLYALDGVVKRVRAEAEERLGKPPTTYEGSNAEEITRAVMAGFYADRPLGGFWSDVGGYRAA